MKLPFSPYDFFGYLSSGFACLLGIDVMLDGQPDWLIRDTFPLSEALLVTLLAYIIGNILASPAKFFLETVLAKRVLGNPIQNLMADKRSGILAYIFYEYRTPLPRGARKRVEEKAKEGGTTTNDDDLFLLAWSSIKHDQTTMARLDIFRDRYGFNRNLSFSFLMLAIAWLVAKQCGTTPISLLWIFCSAFLCVGCFVRYLKFFRQFTYEVFVTFSKPS